MLRARHPQRVVTWVSLLVFLGTLLALTWLLIWSDATHKLDRLLLDTWVRTQQRTVPEDIVVVGIDPASLAEYGRWPWPRQLQADLFHALADAGVEAAVIDMLHIESADDPASDRALAEALQRIPITILPVLTEGQFGAAVAEKLPVPELTRVATSMGHIFMPIDDDGIVRRVFLKSGFRTAHWSTLSLAALERIDPQAPVLQALPGRRVEGRPAPLDWVQDYEVLIPFYGRQGSFDAVAANLLLRGELPPRVLQGKVAFVGLTATGLGDIVPTAVSALGVPLPGVEVHATVFGALRDGSLVTPLSPQLNLYMALLLLPLMLAVYLRARPVWGLAAAMGSALIPVVASLLAYWLFRVWYAPLACSVPVLLSYVLWSWHRLDFVNRFLENELRQAAPHVSEPSNANPAGLKRFFKHASQHLPIEGWRFVWQGEDHAGGQLIAREEFADCTEHWQRHSTLHARRVSAEQGFTVAFLCANALTGHEIERYIDSLARVRVEPSPSRFADSIERLQSNAQTLSGQLIWLRGVKVFSETMLHGSPAGLMVWNPAGELVRGNDTTHRMLPGLSAEPLLVQFIRAVGHDPEQPQVARHLRDLVLHGVPWQLTYAQHERECVVDFSTTGEVLADRLICASVVDVSDIRTVERARAEMVDFLSHDLRSPLISAVYQLDEQTRSHAQFGSINPDALERAERNIRRSLSMMDDLLSIARADNLRREQFGEVLFDAVLDNALDQVAPQARARDIELQVQTDDELWLMGDATSLERAVVNVIGNAIKYSPGGSQVRVQLIHEPERLRLIVRDQGVGIAPAFLDELFTRFRRESNVAEQFKGIGLGLALVARVVRLHDGEVSACNGESGGAVIEVQLPLIALDVLEPGPGPGSGSGSEGSDSVIQSAPGTVAPDVSRAVAPRETSAAETTHPISRIPG